jgi:hypothetical protein
MGDPFLRRGQEGVHILRNAPEAQRKNNKFFSFLTQAKWRSHDRQNVDLLPVAVDGKPSFCLHQYHKSWVPLAYSIKELRTMATETVSNSNQMSRTTISQAKTVLEINCMKKPSCTPTSKSAASTL